MKKRHFDLKLPMRNSRMRTVLSFQVKLLQRDWLVRLFLFVALLIPWVPFSGWIYVPEGLSSADPFLLSFLFNSVQPLFVLFMAYDLLKEKLKLSTLDVIHVRPAGNLDYFGGKALGILACIVVLNVVILLEGIFLHLVWGGNPFNGWNYVFYAVTLTFPTLCFWLGLSLFAGGLIKSRSVTLLVLLFIWGVSCFYLPGVRHGVFDPSGREIPNIFSDVTGHPFLWPYLLHRFCYLLAGVGLGLCAIAFCQRRPGNNKSPVYLLSGGSMLLAVAMLAGESYGRGFRERDTRRAEYREVYRKYASSSVVNLLSCDISCRQVKDSLYGSSRVLLQNKTDRTLPDFVLYLNPYLLITSLKEKGNDIGFTREKQVFLIKRTLLPEECFSLEITYAGKIDDAFCYLNLENTEYDRRELDRSMQFVNVGFRYGRCYSFLSNTFTLLYPECLWYPTALPPENPDNPLSRRYDYSRYSLRVEKREGMMVVSQGERKEENGMSVFKSRENLPGIVLCIGDFVRKSIEIDSVELEWYYFRGRGWGDWNLSLSFEQKKEIFERCLNINRSIYRRPYLYKELKAVETPVTFATHQRKWNDNNNYNQPGLIFLPERFSIKPRFIDFYDLLNVGSEFNLDTEASFVSCMEGIIQDLLFGGMNNLAPLFQDFTGMISDRNYPALDILLKYTRTEDLNIRDYFMAQVKTAMDYLAVKSLEDACHDKTLSAEEMDYIFYLSGSYLSAYLSACTGDDTFYSFLEDFLRRHPFENVDFELFCKAYEEKYKVDLGAVVSMIYSRKGLPLFKVTEVRWEGLKLEEGGINGPMLSFKVFNNSNVEGVISVPTRRRQNGDTLNGAINSFLLKPGECRIIRCHASSVLGHQEFMTHLSRNFPLVFRLPLECDEVTSEGEQDCKRSDFLVSEREIIVDDLDTNFRVIHPRKAWRLSRLFGKKREYEYRELFPIRIKQWTPIVDKRLYGDSIRSGYCKTAGYGGEGVEWRAFIGKPGMYEVFVYISNVGDISCQRKPGTTYYYTVRHAKGETEVALTYEEDMFGWVSLGEFRMKRGESGVILDDRVSKDSPLIMGEIPALVFADAVKWKYKE